MRDYLYMMAALLSAIALSVGPLMLRDLSIILRWRRVARRLGMRAQIGGWSEGDELHGQGAFKLTVTNAQRQATVATVQLPADFPQHFSVLPRSLFTERGELTGDQEFDRRFVVHGEAMEISARLGAAARELLLATRRRFAFMVREQTVRYEQRGVLAGAALEELIGALTEVAAVLQTAVGLAVVAERATRLSEPLGVRQRALELLLRRAPTSAEAQRAGELALYRDSDEEQLLGALLVRDQRAEQKLRALLRNERCPVELRVRALRAMRTDASSDEVQEELRTAAAARERGLRVAVAELLGERRPPCAQALLLGLCADQWPEVQAAGAAGLARVAAVGDLQVEEALLALLRSPEPQVRREAAATLGEMGTLAAVEPLLAITAGLLTSGPLKHVARMAVAAIQSRQVGAEAGHLSLTSTGGQGELSVPEDQGALGLTDRGDPSE